MGFLSKITKEIKRPFSQVGKEVSRVSERLGRETKRTAQRVERETKDYFESQYFKEQLKAGAVAGGTLLGGPSGGAAAAAAVYGPSVIDKFTPKAPSLGPEPSPVPSTIQPVTQFSALGLLEARRRRGRAGSLKTGGRGVLSPPNVRKASLMDTLG